MIANTLYYNRVRNDFPEVYTLLRDLDTGDKAPLAREPQLMMSEATQAQIAEAVAAVPYPMAPQTKRTDRGLRANCATAPATLGRDDHRQNTAISTIVSTHNRIAPVFPASIARGGPSNFTSRVLKLINEAQRFIFMEAFELERPEIVDALQDRVLAGVQVVLFVQPAKDAPNPELQDPLLRQLKDLSRRYGNLHVLEYKAPPNEPRSNASPVQHAKKLICDTPSFPIAELNGGINFGVHSIYNYDCAAYTEGAAALDSLAHLLNNVGAGRIGLPFSTDMVPSYAQIQAAAESRLLHASAPDRDLAHDAVIEMAAAGRMLPERPVEYTLAELQRRLRDRRKVVLSSRALAQPGVSELLREYLPAGYQGSWIKVIIEPMNSREKDAFNRMRKPLRDHGALLLKHDEVTTETSYQRLLNKQLDRAISRGTPIDVAAYCLTDTALIDRLKIAHDHGCPLRVVVDALDVEGSRINQKAVAHLTAYGIDVRVADQAAMANLSRAPREHREDAALHAKTIFGADWVAMGSANFTTNGLNRNIEDGRVVRSRGFTATMREAFFEPLWQAAEPARPMRVYADAERPVTLTQPPPMSTPIEDIVFAVFDLETTGLDAPGDQRIVSISAQGVRIRPDGTCVPVGDMFHRLVDPGTDMTGAPYVVPASAVAIHGLSNAELARRGAEPLAKVLPAFLKHIDSLKVGPEGQPRHVVMAGQNLAFDLPFLDQVLSRCDVADKLAAGRIKTDGCYVDTLMLSRRQWPDARYHNLDAIVQRLDRMEPMRNPSAMESDDDPTMRAITSAADPTREDTPQGRYRDLHDSSQDVALTAEALGKLVALGPYRTLDNLLSEDQLDGVPPIALRECDGSRPSYTLERGPERGIYLRELEDGKPSDRLHRIREHQLLETHQGLVALEVTLGTGRNARTLSCMARGSDLNFTRGGPIYHTLKEQGLHPPRPTSVVGNKPPRLRYVTG